MNKKVLILTGLFLALSIFVIFSLFSSPKGTLVFNAEDYYLPYTVKFPGQVTIELPCTEAECATDLEIGDYTFYIEKEDYYVQEGSVTIAKGETTYFDVALEVVPGLNESAGGISPSVFEKCYGDSVECGLDSEFLMTADDETGYMALWQGDTRRATFTKGMSENLVFVNGNTAVVYDAISGDAYLVDFEKDSRDFAFNVSGLVGLMFLENGEYLAQTESGIFWIKNNENYPIYFGRDLNSVAYGADGKIYFIGESAGEIVTAEGVFVGSYDGINYYVVTDGLDINPDSAVMGSDADGIYVKDGDKEYEVRT